MSSLWISETELLAPLRPQPPVESPPFIHQSTIDDSDNPQSEEYGEEEDAEAPAPAPVALSQPKLDAQHVLSVAGFEVSAKRDRRLLADEQDLIHEALVTEVLRSRRVAAKIRHIFGCDAAAEAPASGEVVVFDETTMQLVCDSWAGPHSGYAPTSFAHLKPRPQWGRSFIPAANGRQQKIDRVCELPLRRSSQRWWRRRIARWAEDGFPRQFHT